MINPTTNLLAAYRAQNSIPAAPAKLQVQENPAALTQYLDTQAVINKPAVNRPNFYYKNNLKDLFAGNSAKILAIIPRTFNAKDLDGNGYINGKEQHGTFLNAIERLDEVKADGFNTLHLLPIHPPGRQKAMGTAGSLYAPADFLKIDPTLIDKNDPRTPNEQFKTFINECHKRGIKVMIDLPSCASFDMFMREPALMAKERLIPHCLSFTKNTLTGASTLASTV
jgi:hypothetical protein